MYLRLEASNTAGQKVPAIMNCETNIRNLKIGENDEFIEKLMNMKHAYKVDYDCYDEDEDYDFGGYGESSYDKISYNKNKAMVVSNYSDDDLDNESNGDGEGEGDYGLDEDYESYLIQMNLINNNGGNGYIAQKPILIDISLEDDDVTTATPVASAFDRKYRSSLRRSKATLYPLMTSTFLTQSPLECPKPLQPGDSLMSYMQLIIKKVSCHISQNIFYVLDEITVENLFLCNSNCTQTFEV